MANTAPESILHQAQADLNEEIARVIELADTPEALELKIKLAAAYRILAVGASSRQMSEEGSGSPK